MMEIIYLMCCNETRFWQVNRQRLRVRLKTSSRITELSQHEADGREFQERKRAAVEIFPVLGEAAATVEPCDRAFDDPALGQLHEPFRLIGSFDDFCFETGQDF